MSDAQALYGAIAVISACVVFIARAVIAAKKGVEAVEKFDEYKPYALLAAKWVENRVPDDYGVAEDATKVAKGLHKLDLYLKKFTEIVRDNVDVAPTKELVDRARAWSVELAERVGK